MGEPISIGDALRETLGATVIPATVDHDADTPRYFSLIVDAARETADRRPADMSPAEWWAQRIHREWVHINSMLTSPPPIPIKGDPVKTGEYHAAGLARLGREVLMAAAHLGFIWAEGMDDPEHIEAELSDLTSELRGK